MICSEIWQEDKNSPWLLDKPKGVKYKYFPILGKNEAMKIVTSIVLNKPRLYSVYLCTADNGIAIKELGKDLTEKEAIALALSYGAYFLNQECEYCQGAGHYRIMGFDGEDQYNPCPYCMSWA